MKRKSKIHQDPQAGLSARRVSKHVRFAVFLTLIGLAYIWNSHYAERKVAEREKLIQEVKALKDTYYMKEAELRAGMRYSQLTKMVDSIGLKRLQKPPYRIDQGYQIDTKK